MAITKVSPGLLDLDSGITISTADNTSQLILTSTDADSSAGPVLELFRNSGSPADNDATGLIYFYGENDNDEKIAYGQIYTQVKDASDGTEDGSMSFYTMKAGTSTETLNLTSGKVGIGTASPSSILHIEGDTNSYASAPVLYFGSTSTANAAIRDWAIGPADDSFGNFHIFRGTSTGSDPISNDGRVFTIASAGGVRIGDSVGTGYALTADIGTEYGAIIQTTESTPSANPAFWVRVDDDGSVEELFRVQNNGLVRAKNGIHFGTDTAAATALDDYEEGTATLTMSAITAAPTITEGNTFTINYTKIGNLVRFVGYSSARNITNVGTGGAKFTGLPFAQAGSYYGHVTFAHTTAFASDVAVGYIENGNTYFYPITLSSTSAANYQTGQRYVMVQGVYHVA